jgi:hypothetical protein
MPDDLDTLALKAGIAQAEGDLPCASALLVLSLLRVGVVERENSRLRESSAVSIARFGTLELSRPGQITRGLSVSRQFGTRE